MIRAGLVSVTFRGLPPERIVDLARQARLEGIEWGGDARSAAGRSRRG
jgi:3-dehydroshikimate dehydratase